jgi:hypothetical protein
MLNLFIYINIEPFSRAKVIDYLLILNNLTLFKYDFCFFNVFQHSPQEEKNTFRNMSVSV